MYKVMIVDDEMLVRIGVKALINWQDLGFEIVAEASNGLSAFEKYVALKPDVVITDIKMPKQDGLWLTKKIKEHNPKTEIILLTCYDDFSYAKEAIKLKVSDYILKAEMEEEELKSILLEKKKKLDATIGKNAGSGEDKFLMKKQQEALLGLLLSSNRSIDLVRKEFAKANLEWNTRSYCFLQFDFRASLKSEKNSEDQIANIITACLELIVNKFKDEDAEIFYKQFGKSITCFIMAHNLNELKLQKWISYLYSSIKQYFNIGFKSANSPIKDTIEEAREYLNWIFEASDYLFYLSDGEHLTKETMHRRSEVQFINNSSMVKEICKCIEEADSEAVNRMVKQIEKMIDEHRGNSLEVKLELSHMINDIFKRFDVFFQDDKDVFAFQKKLMNAEELREAMGIIVDFVNNVNQEITNSRSDNTDIRIKKAVQYIEDNYGNKITLDDIAGHVGISKYYFSVLFKKEKGITFSNYLNSVRIEKAKQLLKNPQVTVNDVAYEFGFNDPQYFSKTFKKYTGMTVTEYRSRYER
ncbi:MAG: response regulator transcription factor [Clostridiales bacterium]|nr:response regulator transcription factor [Clostridiales bacterium]